MNLNALDAAAILSLVDPSMPRTPDGRLQLAPFMDAAGGWQGRVLRGSLHGTRVVIKITAANMDPLGAAAGQSDIDTRTTWLAEAAALSAFGVHVPTPLGKGEFLLKHLVNGFTDNRPAFAIVMERLRGTMEDHAVATHLRSLLGMARALEDLHAAGLSHGEVHRGNFVSDFAHVDAGEDSAPTFRLIDLGKAMSKPTKYALEVDVYFFCGRVIMPHPTLTRFASTSARTAMTELVQLCLEGGYLEPTDEALDLDDCTAVRDIHTAIALRKRVGAVLAHFVAKVQL